MKITLTTENQGNNNFIEDNTNLNRKGKISFENMMKKGNSRINSSINSSLNLNSFKNNNSTNPSNTIRKISFIDEKDNSKSIKEVIEIESYKEYYVDVNEDIKNNECECKLF